MIQIRLLHLLVFLVAVIMSVFLLAPTGTNHNVVQEDIGIVNANRHGAAYNHTTINAAIAGLAGTRGTIALSPKGTWTISGNVTVPATATLLVPNGTTVNITGSATLTILGGLRIESGGFLCPAVGSTVNITGSIDAPITTIFCASGTVDFYNNSKVSRLYPQWWGAIVSDGIDDTVAVRAAINASFGHVVYFTEGNYLISSTIFIDTPHQVHLDGPAYLHAVIQRADTMSGDVFVFRTGRCAVEHLYFFDSGTDTTKLGGAIYLTGTDLNNRAGFMKINDITVSSAAAGGAWQYALYINGIGLRVTDTAGIRDLFVSNSNFFGVRTPGRTIYMDTCVNCFFTNIGIFPAPTTIMGGIEVRGWDGSVNWASGIHFTNVHMIGDVFLEANEVTFFGGSLLSSSSTALTIPSTSTRVTVHTVGIANSSQIVSSGIGSYVMSHETPGGSSTQNAAFPTGTSRLPGFVITGSNTTDDFQGLTRVQGDIGSNPVARLMAGMLNAGSDWEFGVSDNYGAGVNKVPFSVDTKGASLKSGTGVRFDGSTLAQLGGITNNLAGGNASAAITWCTDCAQGTNPCTSGGGSYAVFFGSGWKCPVWP